MTEISKEDQERIKREASKDFEAFEMEELPCTIIPGATSMIIETSDLVKHLKSVYIRGATTERIRANGEIDKMGQELIDKINSFTTEHLKILASLKNSLWISVNDKLPKHSDCETHLVLVYIQDYPNGYMETSMLYPDKTWSHLKKGEIVTHWMELPGDPSPSKLKDAKGKDDN